MTNAKREKAPSPLRSIRRFCLRCCGGQAREVALCTSGSQLIPGGVCSLFPLRFGTRPSERSLEGWQGGAPLRPLKAIRARCLDCAPEDAQLGNCGMEDCPLYPFRRGRNPNRAGVGPAEPLFPVGKPDPARRKRATASHQVSDVPKTSEGAKSRRESEEKAKNDPNANGTK